MGAKAMTGPTRPESGYPESSRPDSFGPDHERAGSGQADSADGGAGAGQGRSVPLSPDTPPDTAPDTTPVTDGQGEGADQLPPVDSITLETDLSPFLKPGIPAAIRNAAMRRKWMLNPVIRDYVDPALDYAWDWNAAAAVPGAGGRILGESVARMLRDVVGMPAQATPEDAAASAPAEVVPDEENSTDAPTSSRAPESASDSPQLSDVQSENLALASARTPRDEPGIALPRRRHGGAAPS
jgi:hypothetical protein